MGLKDFAKNISELFQEKPSLDLSIETTTYKSPYWQDSYIQPYNPDNLVKKKGLEVYDQMESDDQIKACLDIKKRLILSRGFDIITEGKTDKEIEACDFINKSFYYLYDGLFTSALYDILSAIQYGFSVTEKTYKVIEEGDYKGKVTISKLKTRAPHSFEFPQDEYGNVTIKQNQERETGKIINKDKVILFSYKSRFGNPFGRSDLHAAYRAWFFKDMAMRSWAIFNERHGVPIAVGKYGRLQDKSALLTMLKRLQTNTSIAIPKDVEVDFKDVATNKGEALEKAIDNADRMIARSLLIPELLGFSTHTTGSQALGREQFQLFYMAAIESVQGELEDVINEQIIKNICDLNYEKLDNYPYLKFKTISDAEKIAMVDNMVKLVEKGAIKARAKDEEFLRKELNLPELDMDEIEADKRKEEEKEIVPRETIEEKKRENIDEKDEDRDDENEDDEKLAEGETVTLYREKTKYEEKVNFSEIVNSLDTLTRETAIKMSDIVFEIKNRMINHIIKNELATTTKYKEIEELKINPMYLNSLQDVFQTQLRKAFNQAQATAYTEIANTAKFQEYFAEPVTWTPIAPEKALSYLEAQALRIRNVENEFILKSVKNLLYEGIQNGIPLEKITYNVEQFFKQYDVTQQTAIKTKTGIKVVDIPIEDIEGRISTIVTTAINSAYSQGRLAEYTDPQLKGYVKAIQYSAIIDDATTEYCRSMDGKIFDINDPATFAQMPPAHFNCRSTTIAITSDEEYELTPTAEIREIGLPAKGFGGGA